MNRRQVLGEDLLHLVEQPLALGVVGRRDLPRISSSIRRSHAVAGVFCSMFQTCALPELNQKSGLTAGSVSVVAMRK